MMHGAASPGLSHRIPKWRKDPPVQLEIKCLNCSGQLTPGVGDATGARPTLRCGGMAIGFG
jgi:hypothetical protein